LKRKKILSHLLLKRERKLSFFLKRKRKISPLLKRGLGGVLNSILINHNYFNKKYFLDFFMAATLELCNSQD
jgi:hypothetical protein